MSLSLVSQPPRRLALGVAGAALFLAVLAVLDRLTTGAVSLPALVPPFGASVIIVFFTPEAPAGKPWNVLVGHTLSALLACTVLALMPDASTEVLAATAVCAAGVGMVLTKSIHPPGGATALLAVVMKQRVGFAFVLCPVLLGAASLTGIRLGLDRVAAWLIAADAERSLEAEPEPEPEPD